MKTTMKIKPLAGALMSAGLLGLAQTALATNGDQMIGVTATQWGMGGAVLAAPQDAATMMFNPAGLSTLPIKEVRFDMGFGVLNPPRQVNDLESDSNYYMMPAGAAAFRVNDRLMFGMAMGGLSGMGVDFGDTNAVAPNSQAIVTTKQFYKIAPGFSYQVNDRLAVGAALNIDYQSLALYTPAFQLPQNQVFGYGGSAGLVYRFNDRFQVGANYISKQSMDAFEWNTASTTSAGGTFSMTMDAPEQYGIGLAFKPTQRTLIAFDVKQIKYSDVMDVIDITRPAGYTSTPTSGVPPQLAFGWDDITVYALGIQHQVNPKTVVRAGLNYSESPIGPEDVNQNLGSLAVVEEHASVGLTRQLGSKVYGSLSYMHAFHNEVVSNTLMNGQYYKIELEQNIYNVQLSYVF